MRAHNGKSAQLHTPVEQVSGLKEETGENEKSPEISEEVKEDGKYRDQHHRRT